MARPEIRDELLWKHHLLPSQGLHIQPPLISQDLPAQLQLPLKLKGDEGRDGRVAEEGIGGGGGEGRGLEGEEGPHGLKELQDLLQGSDLQGDLEAISSQQPQGGRGNGKALIKGKDEARAGGGGGGGGGRGGE